MFLANDDDAAAVGGGGKSSADIECITCGVAKLVISIIGIKC